MMGERGCTYRILVGKPEGKRKLSRPRFKQVDNIKICFQEIGWEHVEWIDLALDRDRRQAVVNVVINL
jgi:hypothetical protein